MLGALAFAVLALLLSAVGACSTFVCRWTLLLSLGLAGRPRPISPLPAGAWWMLGLSSLAALAPTTHVDTQVYHYPLPLRYLEHGGWHWTGIGPFDGIFHLYHLMLVWPLALAGEPCANLLGPTFLVVLAQTLVSFLPASKLGWWLVASSPLLVLQSSGGLPELPAAALALAALGWWNRGLERRCDRQLSLAALLCGATVSMRLNLAPLSAALALSGLLLRAGLGNSFKPLLATLLMCSPWIASNVWHTGQPLYPIGKRWRVQHLRVSQPAAPGPVSVGGLPDQLPWNILQPLRSEAPLRLWQDTLTPVLVGGALLGLTRAPRGLAWPALTYLLLLIPLRVQTLRYGTPGAVWLMPLALHGWASLPQFPARALLGLGVACGLTASWSFLPPRLRGLVPGPSQEQYLSQRQRPYEVYRWLAGTSYQRVLMTFGQSYRCPKPWFTYLQDDLGALAHPHDEYSLAGIQRALEARGIDLVLIDTHHPACERAVNSPEHPDVWRDRPDQTQPVWDEFRFRTILWLLQGQPVVYSRNGVQAIEWPRR